MKKIKLVCLVVLLFSLTSVGTVFAKEDISSSLEFYGLKEIKSTTEIKREGNVEVTITRQEFKGSKEELEAVIEQMRQEGRFIMEVDQSEEPSGVSTQGLKIGNSMKYKGDKCSRGFVWACVYGNGELSANAFGLLGYTTSGQIISQITKDPETNSNVTDFVSRPRQKVVAYGLVGGESIVVNTYEYIHPDWESLAVFNFQEKELAILVYVEVFQGAEFKYKVNGASHSILTELYKWH